MTDKKALWAGRILTLLVTAFLLFDGATGLLAPESLAAEMAATGFAQQTLVPISLIAIAAGLLFVIPRTAMIGAICISGFVGGAICTHFRVEGFATPPEIVCFILGVATWGALWLRDARVRALLTGGVDL